MNGGAAEDTSGAAIKKSWGEETHREGKRKKLNAHMAWCVQEDLQSAERKSQSERKCVKAHIGGDARLAKCCLSLKKKKKSRAQLAPGRQ